jgi:hypothetical protein
MFALDLFNTRYERQLQEGGVDNLEARRIDDLNMKMQELLDRVKEPAYQANPKALAALKKQFQQVKDERDEYYKVREAGIPGSVPTEKIPGKEDLLKGRGRSYYESQKKNSDSVDEGQVSDEVDHRGDVDTRANIEVLGVDLNDDTFKITYNGKPYQVKIQLFSQEDLGRWQIADYDVDIINSKGKNIIDLVDWDNDRQVTMVNTIIAYLDTQQAGDIQLMAWREVGIVNSTAEALYQEIQDFYKNDQQKIDKATAWLAQNIEDADQRQVFADFVKNPVSRPAKTKYVPKEYLMYVAFSYSREGNTELTPGMNLPTIKLTDPDDEEELYRKVDELFKKVQFKFDAFENKIIELADSYGLGSDPDLESGFGQRSMFWDHKTMTTSSSESNKNRQQILAQGILKFQAEVEKYVASFNNTLIKIGLPGIGEYSTWSGVLGDQLTDQQVRYFDTPEGFANLASGKVDLAKMLDDNVEKLGLKETGNPTLGEKKLGQLRPTLGTGHDIGRSVRKFRAQRGLDEYISMGSDKNFVEAEPYKNYRIYVRKKPFGTPGMYTAHTEIDRKEFKEPGASQEEAVQAIRDRIDSLLNAQRKVTGSSTIDFNVKFATDLLADPRQTFYAKLEKINGEPKLVIASADIASDPELLAAGDFKRSALRNQPDEQGRATPLPGIPLTAKGLRSGDWIANGRYTVGNETQDRDGNRVFDLTYHSTAHTKSDKLRLNQPAFTLGTAREVDEEKGTGPLDQKLQRLKVQARRQFPRAHTDDEALILKMLDKETQDDRENRRVDARQDAELAKNFALDREQEDEIEDLQTQISVKEHGGGIGPRQHWQDLMQERKLSVGDPVVVTAPNEFEGKTGEIYDFAPSGKFVIVDLYNHGKHSMHLSDVEYNQYADDQEDEDDWYDEGVAEAISKKDLLIRLQKDLPKVTNPKNKNAKPVQWMGAGKDDYGYTGYQGHGMPTDKQERELARKKKGVAEEVDKAGALKAAQQAAKFMIRNLDDRAALKDYSMHFWSPEKFYQGATMAMRGVGVDEIVRHITQDRPAQFESGVAETVTDPRAGMAEIYRRLAPKIERHRDSFLAGQLYDELENYAELHGAEREFRQMMNSARNRAHMEYDTNPGGFHNWFWFLPFEDQDLKEGMIKDIDIMRQDLDSMSDLQFLRAYGMNKDQFKYKYRSLLKPAPQQDVPVQESLRPGEYYVHTVYFKDGAKKRIRVTSDEFDVADYYTKRGQSVDRVDYDFQLHSDMTEAEKEPTTRQELLNRVDKIQRMMSQERNPANLQILRKELEMLKQRYQHLREDNDSEAVERAILNRIMVAHTDLLMKYGPDKVMQAAEEVSYNVGDVDEIGTSDVSAYVAQVKQILGAVNETQVNEKWTAKYKKSINCANPKGFSQKAHCAGRKK